MDIDFDRTVFRVCKNKDKPFVMIPTDIARDKNLSAKAKGLMLYFLSRPDDWQFYLSEVSKNMSDKRDSILSGIRELLANGYMTREKTRDKVGRFTGYEYNVFEVPTLRVRVVHNKTADYNERLKEQEWEMNKKLAGEYAANN